MDKTTLLFNQQGIKAVEILDTNIIVHFADGGNAIEIFSTDEMFGYYKDYFSKQVDRMLNPVVEDDITIG